MTTNKGVRLHGHPRGRAPRENHEPAGGIANESPYPSPEVCNVTENVGSEAAS